jgi:hypothetical protein
MRGVEVRLPLTDTHAVSTPEPKPWWRFSFAYYVGFAALGAIALAYGFLPAALAILSLIAGLAGALYVGLQMLSLRSSSATRRAAWAEDVSWSLPYALVAGMLIFALGMALLLAGVGTLGVEAAAVVASLGVSGVFAVIGWRRGKARRR